MRSLNTYKELYNLRDKFLHLKVEIMEKETLALKDWDKKCIDLLINCLSFCNFMETHFLSIPRTQQFPNDIKTLFNNILSFSKKNLLEADKENSIEEYLNITKSGHKEAYLNLIKSVENIINQVPLDADMLQLI